MGDRDFGDAASCPRGIDRYEAVHLAIELDAGQRLAPVSLQTAAVIVKLDPVQLRYKPVGNARRELTREPRVFAIFAPAGHDVVSLIQLFKQASDVGRIVLKIRVHRNQYLSTRVIDACAHRGGLSVVAPERNHSKRRRRLRPQVARWASAKLHISPQRSRRNPEEKRSPLMFAPLLILQL